MKIAFDIKSIYKPTKIFLIAMIILYPFVHTFIGIDLGDTGYHLYAFENLYETPELIGFTSYFTTFLGWAWLKLFPGLGLWGLNFLEFILEMIMSYVVYKTVSPFLGELQSLFGIIIAITASDTYLNIFNYHQFNVFLLVLIMAFQFTAIVKDKKKYSVFSGICFAVVVFSRMGSITAIVTCFLYVFWYLVKNKSVKFLWANIAAFFSGTILTSVGMLILLKITGQFQYFINNIFRLSGLASTSDSGYGMSYLWEIFFIGNLDAIASGAIYLSAFFILLVGISILLNKTKFVKYKVLNIFVGIVATGIAIYQMFYAYNVNPAPSWPQMTTGPSFIIGICYVITFLCLCYHLYGNKGKHEIALITIMAYILPLLTIAGSNTGTKHVILGLWFIAPIASYTLLELIINQSVLHVLHSSFSKVNITISRASLTVSLCIMLVCMGGKFVHMLYHTMNFDSIDRSMINSTINSPKLKFLRTTKREADAVNGVLRELEMSKAEEYPLMVFGGSIMYYYLTERDSFVQPWFTNGVYANETLMQDLEKGYEKFDKLPIVIYGRTNNYHGFYASDYEMRIQSEKGNTYSGKKDILLDFLKENKYGLQYVNDYYLVLFPPDILDGHNRNYVRYITNTGD